MSFWNVTVLIEVLSADVVLVGVEPALKSKRYSFPLKKNERLPLNSKNSTTNNVYLSVGMLFECSYVCIHMFVFACGCFNAVKICNRSMYKPHTNFIASKIRNKYF